MVDICTKKLTAVIILVIVLIISVILVIYFAVTNTSIIEDNSKTKIQQIQNIHNNTSNIGLKSPLQTWKPLNLQKDTKLSSIEITVNSNGQQIVRKANVIRDQLEQNRIYQPPDNKNSEDLNVIFFDPENNNIQYGNFTSTQNIKITLTFDDFSKDQTNISKLKIDFFINVDNYKPSPIIFKENNAVITSFLDNYYNIKNWAVESNGFCTILNTDETYSPQTQPTSYMDDKKMTINMSANGLMTLKNGKKGNYLIKSNTSNKGYFEQNVIIN